MGSPNTSSLVWNPVTHELVIAQQIESTARTDHWTADELYRFKRDGGAWTRTVTPVQLPTSGGEWGNVTADITSPLTRGQNFVDNIGVLGDGSYVIAPDADPVIRTSGGVRYRMGALHLRTTAGQATVTEIPGTVIRPYFLGAYYDGFLSARGLGDGSVVLHGRGSSLDDFARVSVDENGTAVRGEIVAGPDLYPPYEASSMASSVADDPTTGGLWVVSPDATDQEKLVWYDGTTRKGGYMLRSFTDYQFSNYQIHTLSDGSIIVPVTDYDATPQLQGWQRIDNLGLAPALTSQPQSVAATIASGSSSVPVSFEVAVDGSVPGTLQWQRKRDGETAFTDLPGETGPTLGFDAVPTDDGSSYRVLVTNDAGRISSTEAALDLDYAPVVVQQPFDVRTEPGTSAQFSVLWEASPDATLTWQRKVGGFWETVVDDDNFALADGSLTVRETDVAQSGTQLRARLRNAVGTTYSRVVGLDVAEPQVGPATLSDVSMEWTGSLEMQARPPFGASSFFSAGVSDGTQATYAATAGDVSVVQRSTAGDQPATWETRGRHVDDDASTQQVVVLEDGEGDLAADGSARIAWDGAWTVNFYDGLVPFTVADPVLELGPDGSGTLSGDLSGYGASQENPNEKTPVEPRADVVISTFAEGTFDPAGFTVTPDYAGVEVTVPDGGSAQVRTGPDWGAWPQEFVDFHGATGLTSYWYSSGGAADPLKSGAPVVIGPAELGAVEVVAPAITTQPTAARVTVTRAATFAVSATGADLSYQWQRRFGSSWLDLSNQRAARLRMPAVAASDDGALLRVRVSNAAGAVLSRAVRLDVAAARAVISTRTVAARRPVVVATVTSGITRPVRGRIEVRTGGRTVASERIAGTGAARVRLPRSLKPGLRRVVVVFVPADGGVFGGARVVRTVRVLR